MPKPRDDNRPRRNPRGNDGPDRKDSDTRRPPLARQLHDLDHDLAALLVKRAMLFAKATGSRVRNKLEPADANLEKELWTTWQDQLGSRGFDPKLLRQVFTLLNGMALDTARAKAPKSDGFVFHACQAPVDIDLPGPSSLRESRIWAFLAAASGSATTISPVVMNDPMFELAKALNNAGADFTWSGETIAKARTRPASLENESVFCGHDAFNFYLLLAYGLTFPGRIKYAGGASLKMLDLRQVNRILLRLGARLMSIDPKGSGLPARLECGGLTTSQLELDETDLDAESHKFVEALLLAAWTYPEGLTVTWPTSGKAASQGRALTERLKASVNLLVTCGVDADLTQGRASVAFLPPDKLRFPETPPLTLDPLLSLFLLAMPLAQGGRVRLAGHWPSEDQCAATGLAMLRAAGLSVKSGVLEIVAEAQSTPPHGELPLEAKDCPHYFPLALAMGLASGRRTVLAAPDGNAAEIATDLLTRLGAPFDLHGDRLVLREESAEARRQPADGQSAAPWMAPSPIYCLALALTSMRRPGPALANPATLSAEWPGFWSAYTRLPAVRSWSAEKPNSPKEKEGGDRKGRRFRIGGDPRP